MTAPNLNYDALKKTREGGRGGFGWKPKEGENRVRVLPPHSRIIGHWENMTDIAVQYRIHFFRVKGQIETSRCLRELKQDCPACDMYWAHNKSDDPGLKALADDIRAGTVYLMNIIDLNDTAKGIQHWPSNNTCWGRILDIVSSPQWGNVLDLQQGVNFVIKKQGGKGRGSFPQYEVVPDPARTSVVDIIQSQSDWRERMDGLSSMVPEPMDPADMVKLLDEKGFPPMPNRSRMATVIPPTAPTVTPPVVQTSPAPQPVPVITGTPVPQPPPATTAINPQPVATAPLGAAPPPNPAPAPTAPSGAAGPHYDPGPSYTPKVADDQRPAGAPRCFGDYDPRQHQCMDGAGNPVCPVISGCQMKLMGIA